MTDQKSDLIKHIVEMQEDEAIRLTREMLEAGFDPLELLAGCREAMDLVGQRFEAQEYFLPELMMAGDMLSQISALAKPLITRGDDEEDNSHGTVVIGTVNGDLHDIGKDIVSFMLEINGFKVVDLGIDVPVVQFITAIREHQPEVVALSGFLTLAFDSMKETVDAIEDADLRGQLKIMIGGGQVDESVKNHTGADAYGMNAMDAVNLCRNWMSVAA
ncbi:Uncharacterized corrinoid protein [hydrothermal vent metagenome]|uniref:Uncharacterized corrinoid protein n=1 Tax=hydrothermal vent metagenome TaxID=652676 RepID=A0A3B0RLR2_9ZZZZ